MSIIATVNTGLLTMRSPDWEAFHLFVDKNVRMNHVVYFIAANQELALRNSTEATPPSVTLYCPLLDISGVSGLRVDQSETLELDIQYGG